MHCTVPFWPVESYVCNNDFRSWRRLKKIILKQAEKNENIEFVGCRLAPQIYYPSSLYIRVCHHHTFFLELNGDTDFIWHMV